MEYVNINEKTYGYVVNFKDNDVLRNSFNDLTRKTFGFDFEEWYQNGYWQDRYIPYALLDGDHIVSNISVNVIDFLDMGEKKRYIQIGTVMTDENYRNQGLNRFLMEKVLEGWEDQSDLIYLFANDSVLEFYPKFGFVPVSEYQHSKEIFADNSTSNVTKLDMSAEKDRNFLVNMINDSKNYSQLSMQGNASLVMFYCTSFLAQNVYYIDSLDTIVIAAFDDSILYIYDVFSRKEVPLDDIISAMANKEIKKVVLGFTPKDTTTFEVTLLKEEDTTLFVMESRIGIFKDRKIMFPVLSHA